MSDSRTTEQRTADEALTAAIEQVNIAYYGDSGRLLTDYVVVFAETSWDEDSDAIHAVGTNPRDGDQALYKTAGLLDHALTRTRYRITQPSDD